MMTFDIDKARKICGRIKGYEDPDGGNSADFEAVGMLPAALDEIDQQAKRIADLEESLTAAHMLGYHEAEKKCRDKIAELEAFSNMLHRDCESLQDRSRKAESTVYKQRAALKKMAGKLRARGKALVEERAQYLKTLDDNQDCPAWDLDELAWPIQNEYRIDAREQLRQEGKL